MKRRKRIDEADLITAVILIFILVVGYGCYSTARRACHARGGEYVHFGKDFVCFKNGQPIETWGP